MLNRGWTTFQPCRRFILYSILVLPTFPKWLPSPRKIATSRLLTAHALKSAVQPPGACFASTIEQKEGESHHLDLQSLAETHNFAHELFVLIDELSVPDISQHHASTLLAQIKQNVLWMNALRDMDAICYIAEQWALSETPYRAHRLLRVANLVGVRFKQNVYERVAFRLAENGHWYLIITLVSLAKYDTGRTTVRLLNWYTRALLETQHFTLLGQILERFASEGLKPQRRTFHLALRGHLLNHDLPRARSTIQAMEQAGFPVVRSTYATIVKVYRGLGSDKFVEDRAYEILADAQFQEGATVMNSLLRIYLDIGDLEGGLRLLESVESLVRDPAKEDFSIGTDGENRVPESGQKLHMPILANCATYTILIDHLAAQRDLSWLNGILQRMIASNITPDAGVAASLIRAFYARGSEALALQTLRDICRAFELDTDALKRLGFKRMPTKPLYDILEGGPTMDIFNSLLQGALKMRGVQAVSLVLKLMKSVGLTPDATTLQIFLSYLEKHRNFRSRHVLRILDTLLCYRMRPTLKHLHIILRSIVRTEKHLSREHGWDALAASLQRKFSSQGSEESRTSSKTALSLADPNLGIELRNSVGVKRVMRRILASLSARSVRANRATFALRMRYDVHTRTPEDAVRAVEDVFQHMKDRGLHPTAYHNAALMEAHCVAGDMHAASTIMRDALEQGNLHSEASKLVMYTILISGYSRSGRPDEALRIFKEILGNNVAPDIAAVDAVVGAFFAVKAKGLARRVLLDLWPMVAPFPAHLKDASLLRLITALRSLRDGTEAGKRVGITMKQRRKLAWRIEKIIMQWKAMSRKESITYPRALNHETEADNALISERDRNNTDVATGTIS